MKKAAVILPVLAHLLFGAHLLFHGFALWIAVLPLAALVLMFVPIKAMHRAQQLLLVIYAAEWARAGGALIARRTAEGGAIHPAAEIMAGVTLFTLLAVFFVPRRVREPEANAR